MWSRIGRFVLTLSAITLMLPVWGRAQDFRGTHLTGASLSYPMPPFSYEGSRAVTVTFRTRPDVLRALVPEPLGPNAAGELSGSIVHLPIVAPVSLPALE